MFKGFLDHCWNVFNRYCYCGNLQINHKVVLILCVIFLAASAVSVPVSAEESYVIAQDSLGLIVEVKENDEALLDTVTVVMIWQGQYMLVHRSGFSACFPTSFHSCRVIGRIGDDCNNNTVLPDSIGDCNGGTYRSQKEAGKWKNRL